MVDVVNLFVNAVIISALYALVATGFTLIFGVGGVLNLAHGASITLGAFGAYYVAGIAGQVSVLGLGIPAVAILAAIVVPAIFSALLYWGIIERVEDEPIMVMILTLVTAVAIEQIILSGFGGQPKVLPSIVTTQVTIAGTAIEGQRLIVFVLSWV